MQRFFVITLTELNFEKKDLNVPFSEDRLNIGKLSRIVTNAIFLSHSLRENVFIRIFVEKPQTREDETRRIRKKLPL